MGIKNLREHFAIGFIVKREESKESLFLIGTGYCGNIIVIKPDYSVIWGTENLGRSHEGWQKHYKDLTEASDSGRLKALIEGPDHLGQTLPVWTYKRGQVIKKECEVFGWPNTTVDGELMYDNTFFKDRKTALAHCRNDVRIGLKWSIRAMPEAFRSIGKKLDYLAKDLIGVIRSHLLFGI
jgi:hypothetical protein